MNDQFPGGCKASFGFLFLPELQIKGSIEVLDSPSAHHCKWFHHDLFSSRFSVCDKVSITLNLYHKNNYQTRKLILYKDENPINFSWPYKHQRNSMAKLGALTRIRPKTKAGITRRPVFAKGYARQARRTRRRARAGLGCCRKREGSHAISFWRNGTRGGIFSLMVVQRTLSFTLKYSWTKKPNGTGFDYWRIVVIH